MARRRLRASQGGNVGVTRHFPALVGTVSTAVLLAAALGQAQAPQAPAAAGRRTWRQRHQRGTVDGF